MIYFIIIYLVSFILSYLVIRWTFKTVWTSINPGLRDLLIVIFPFVNTVAFIMMFIFTSIELYIKSKKSFTTNKFFNIKKRP
jgi:hypothetical protein